VRVPLPGNRFRLVQWGRACSGWRRCPVRASKTPRRYRKRSSPARCQGPLPGTPMTSSVAETDDGGVAGLRWRKREYRWQRRMPVRRSRPLPTMPTALSTTEHNTTKTASVSNFIPWPSFYPTVLTVALLVQCCVRLSSSVRHRLWRYIVAKRCVLE